MKNKKTIVAGCSWTDRKFKSRHLPDLDTSWKKWDEHLGDYYNWDVVNVGKSGASNDYMIDKALNAIYNEGTSNVERCIIALSQWGRFKLPTGELVNPNLLNMDPKFIHPDMVMHSQTHRPFFDLYPYNHRVHKARVEDILLRLYTLVDICIAKDIELVVFQMIDSLETFKSFCTPGEYVYLNKMFMEHPNFLRIEEAEQRYKNIKIMGWPFSRDLDGISMMKLLAKKMGKYGWAISDLDVDPKGDGHPSAAGNQEIANIFIEWYNDLN